MKKEQVRIVFMGTPAFAVPALDALLAAGYPIAGVVTAPDKMSGRGRKIKFSPVKGYALSRGLVLLQPEKLKDPLFIEQLRSLKADLQVVVAFRMLPEVVWNMPPMGTFNLHASLLPQYRGAAPINHVLIQGETVTGLTTFFLDKDIDTGRIINQVKLTIDPDEDFGHLHDRMMAEGAKLVVKTVDELIHNKVKTIPQNKLISEQKILKPAPKLHKDDCHINWHDYVDRIFNFIRGLSPYPGAFCFLKLRNGEKLMLKIFRAEKELCLHHEPAGTFQSDGNRYLKVSAGDGYIHLMELQLQGKKRMNVGDFLNGFDLKRLEIVE